MGKQAFDAARAATRKTFVVPTKCRTGYKPRTQLLQLQSFRTVSETIACYVPDHHHGAFPSEKKAPGPERQLMTRRRPAKGKEKMLVVYRLFIALELSEYEMCGSVYLYSHSLSQTKIMSIW
jgi:hypothetical protein